MTNEQLAFFTLDHGTASTAAALVGRCGGRFRILAAGTVPTGVGEDALLEDLVTRVAAADEHVLPDPDGWRDWARLTAQSSKPPRVLCAAGSERRLHDTERVVSDAGWWVTGHVGPGHIDPLSATEAALDRELDAIVVAAGEPATSEERAALPLLCALLGAAAYRRRDVRCLLSGAAAEHREAFPSDRVVIAPPPDVSDLPARSALRDLVELLPARPSPMPGDRPPHPDVRRAFRASVVSLAGLLERRVEAVEVGHGAGARVLAGPDGLRAHLVRVDGALVPPAAMSEDRIIDGILRWSTLRGDVLAMRDRVRNLRVVPWQGAAGDGARLRMAAARAALARLDSAWVREEDPARRTATATDILIASGGVFAVAPPPAVALALLDTLRRPGAMALFHDHARVLGPIGTLPEESDRRRLLADLLDDALVPLGSAVLAADLRAGRQAGTVRITRDGSQRELELLPGTVQLVDLPPGLPATAEIETREAAWLGVRAHHVAVGVTGGLGGLLLDTRDVPLRLPERVERRREVLEAWEGAFWAERDT